MNGKKHTESQSELESFPNSDPISEDNKAEMAEEQSEIHDPDESSEDLPKATAETVSEKTAAADPLEADKDLAAEEPKALEKEAQIRDDRKDDSAKSKATEDKQEIDENRGSPEETAAPTENKDTEENEHDVEEDNVAASTQIDQMSDDDKEQAGDNPDEEMPAKPAHKISPAKAAVSAALILAVFCGFFIFNNNSKIKTIETETSKTLGDKKAFRKQQKQKPLKHQVKESNSIYDSKIREINTLREALLHKQKEVIALKRNYQRGIEELEKEISDELMRAGISTFLQAMENKRIEFGLRTIQRRQDYIRRLEGPQNWIFEASEELLYIMRRAMVDLEVSEIASGIDMNKHMQHMDEALQKFRPTADRLSIEMPDTRAESLEAIWERIESKRMRNTAVRAHSKNRIIAEQICAGDFKRLTELTEISAGAAKCIAEMKGSDLFLNGLSEISPGVARHLFQWKGSWICLNGIRALSPRVAHYLFQWDGDWISLNGLTEFPAEIGETLLQWNGSQLELMGLKYTNGSPGNIGIEYLAQWERSGGRLFVPAVVRKKINALNRKSNGT